MLKINWHDLKDNIVLVIFEGNLDFDTELYFKKMMENILKEGKYNLIFDFSKVEYANSYGFNVLNETKEKIHQNKGSLKLINVQSNVLMLLQLVGLAQKYDFYNSIEEALESKN
jgi:anti-anti-sigma factor